MATEQSTSTRPETDVEDDTNLRYGAALMTIGALGFVGYGVAFLALAFVGDGFEIGVATLDGLSRSEMAAANPETAHYITHLHIATAAFIVGTGIAAAGLSWYGVRRRQRWAWATAVAAPVVALALAIPMHWFDFFAHDWLSHLGPIYLATVVFVIGAALSLRSLLNTPAGA